MFVNRFLAVVAFLSLAACGDSRGPVSPTSPNFNEHGQSGYLFQNSPLVSAGQWGDPQPHTPAYINRVIAPQLAGLTGLAATLLKSCLDQLAATVAAGPDRTITAVIAGSLFNDAATGRFVQGQPTCSIYVS